MIFRPALLLTFLLIILGCTDSKKYPIESARVDINYYLTALSEVEAQLKSNQDNFSLRMRKLLISRELNWPEDVRSDISFLRKEMGLSYELMQYAVDFYQSYNYHEEVLTILEEWESINSPFSRSDRLKIDAYLGLGRYREASYLLWEYIQSNKNNVEALLFAARNYLEIGDSTRAIYAYRGVAEIKPGSEELLNLYVPMLIQMGYPERAADVLAYQKVDSANLDKRLVIGEVYFKTGDVGKAHDLLRGDSSSRSYLKRIDWFEQTLQWDSAVNQANKLIRKDSSNMALIRKAQLLENRGWLSSSYNLYGLVLDRDSTNSIAVEGAKNVGRKIAYLRSLREAEEKIPVMNVSPKKATENNE